MAETTERKSGYLHRPYLRKSTHEGINRVTDKKQWEFKQDKTNYTREYTGSVKNGPLRDENTGKVIHGKPDIGHRSGYEERVMQECAERMHLSQKDYNNLMNNPKLYQYEDKSSNRSHTHEETNKKAQVSKAMREINRYLDAKKANELPESRDRRLHQNSAKDKSAAKTASARLAADKTASSDRTLHNTPPRRSSAGASSHDASSHATASHATSSHGAASHGASSHDASSHGASHGGSGGSSHGGHSR